MALFDTERMQAQRALVACAMEAPDQLGPVTAELFEAFWIHKEAIQTPQISLPVIADVVGDELARAIARKVRHTTYVNRSCMLLTSLSPEHNSRGQRETEYQYRCCTG
jgi:hypothetical protein